MQAFLKRLNDHLSKHFPRQVPLDADSWDAFFKIALDKCRRYKIITEMGITIYCHCMILLGEDFDNDKRLPWAIQTLSGHAVLEKTKIQMLVKFTEAELDKKETANY